MGAWKIASWNAALQSGTITSQIGELAFDSKAIKPSRWFDGLFEPGDSVEITLETTAAGHAVQSLAAVRGLDEELERVLGAGVELVALARQAEVLPMKTCGPAVTQSILFFDPLHVELPTHLPAIARIEQRDWDEVELAHPDIRQRLGVDPEELGGEVFSLYGVDGTTVGHVVAAGGCLVWRAARPPQGIADGP